MTAIVFDVDRKVLFVDLSYVLFTSFYSVAKAEEGRRARLDPDAFRSAVGCSIASCIRHQMRKHGVQSGSTFLVRDCPKKDIWRNGTHSAYKARTNNPPPPPRSATRGGGKRPFDKSIFGYVYSEVIPRLPMQCVSADRMEADDIIAVCTRAIRLHTAIVPVVIVSNDGDFIQLADEHTRVCDVRGRSLLARAGGLSPMQYLAHRIVSGDRADNIGPIVGRNTTDLLRNWQLMDFRCIPARLVVSLEGRIEVRDPDMKWR